MLTDCYGRSISSACVALLWCNVVANIYNLVIISLTDETEIRALLDPNSDVKQLIIIIQTVLSICCITLSIFQKTSCLIFSLTLWMFGSTVVFLFMDIMQTYTTAVAILSSEKISNEFWMARTDGKESVAPDNFYYVVTAGSIIYLVFKLLVAYTILRTGKQLRDHLFTDAFFLGDDIERDTLSEETISSDLPPSYEQCVVTVAEDTPPPPYNVIQQYIQKY